MKRRLAAILAFVMVLVTCMSAMAGSYSLKWTQKSDGNWQVYKNGVLLKNTWILDDECNVEGGVWYLIDENGNMVVAPLVHDGEGRYYAFNDQHNGYYGAMLTATGNYFGTNLVFEQNHNGGFGSITNEEGIAALTAKYGVKEMPNIKNTSTVKLSEVNKVSVSSDEDLTVYYKLSFDLNGVTVTTPSNYAEQKVASGQLAKAPAATPSDVTGTYSFAGWFNGDTAWNFAADKVTKDTTLTAFWSLNDFTVSFDANGGSFPDGSKALQVKCEPGSLISEPDDKPAMTGKVFDGWYKDKEGTTRWDFSDDAVTSNTTLYAKWIGVFTVTFDANGGSFAESKTTFTEQCTSGNLVSAPETAPTKSGKTFGGWYKEAECTNAWDFYSDTVTSDVTLYAKWADPSYELDRFVFNYYFQYTYTNECNLVLGSQNDLASYLGEQISKKISEDDSVKMYQGTGDYAGYIMIVADGDHAVVFPEDSHELFCGFQHVKKIEFQKVDASKVTNMNRMFTQCSMLEEIKFPSDFNTANVTDMGAMFCYDNKLKKLDLSSFDTQNVTDMMEMFCGCRALTTITGLDQLNTANVTTMQSMFSYCNVLTAVDVSNFNTAKVTSMRGMFNCCHKLTTLDLTSFDTANVTDMSTMFNMDTADSVTSLLTTIYASDKFVTNNVTADTWMFKRCSSLKGVSNGSTKTTLYDSSKTGKAYACICTTNTPGYFSPKTPH